MTGVPGGGVVVRLTRAPWLVRHAANGVAQPLAVERELSWASGFAVADDRSIFLAGTIDAQLGKAVRIDRLSADGALLQSVSWPFPNPPDAVDLVPVGTAEVGGITRGADGYVYLLVDGQILRAIVRLNQDGTPDEVAYYSPAYGGGGGSLTFDPAQLTVGNRGRALISGGKAVVWLNGVSESDGWWSRLEALSVTGLGRTHAADDGWFVPFYAETPAARRGLAHLDQQGNVLWSVGDFVPGPDGVEEPPPSRLTTTTLVDSVLLASSASAYYGDELTSEERPTATLVRYTLTGQLVQAVALPAILDVASVGESSAVFLEHRDRGYALEQRDFVRLAEP